MMRKPELVSDQAVPFLDFLQGFLEGINIKGDINKILECVKGGEGIIEKIIQALNYLIHIDINHLEDIIKGVKLLIEAVQDIIKVIEPCSKSFEEIMNLINKIISINIMKLVWTIITNAPQFIHDITDAIDALTKGNYRQGGKDVGDIIFRLFLASLQSDPIIDFVKGFLEGLNEKGDFKKLLDCIENMEPIILKMIQALQKIMTFNIMDVIEGVKLLIEAVTEFISVLKPCSEGLVQLEKLFDAIISTGIMKIVTKIISNPAPYLKDIMDCIEAFTKGNMHQCGKDLGDIMYRLYLTDLRVGNISSFVEFVEGFIEGIDQKHNFNNITECIKRAPEIWTDIVNAIELLKHIDWKNLDKLIEALLKIFDALKTILAAIKPCSKVPAEIEILIKKIMEIDFSKLIQKFQQYMFQIVSDLMAVFSDFQKGNYKDAGKQLGDILYLLVFKE